MVEYSKTISKANLRDDLEMTFEPGGRRGIALEGQRIGGMVHFGRSVGMDRKKVKTVWASRIYGDGLRIEVEASNPSGVLDKVAAELARQLKAKRSADLIAKSDEQSDLNVPSSPKI